MPIEHQNDFESVIGRSVQPTGLKLQLRMNEPLPTENIVQRMQELYGERQVKTLAGGSGYQPLLIAASLPSHDNDRSYIVLGVNDHDQAELMRPGQSYSKLEVRQINDLEPCNYDQLDVMITRGSPQEEFESHISRLDGVLNPDS